MVLFSISVNLFGGWDCIDGRGVHVASEKTGRVQTLFTRIDVVLLNDQSNTTRLRWRREMWEIHGDS